MKVTAVYAGSFDPFTYGHQAVTEEAIRMFGKVTIAVGKNSAKKGLFSPEERIDIIREYYPERRLVRITSFEGLLVDFCKEWTNNMVVLIRGLRMMSDFESEMTIAAANRKLNSNVSTVFVPTLPDIAFVSSSVVKEIARYTRDIRNLSPYVTGQVARKMMTLYEQERKISARREPGRPGGA